MIKNYRGYPYFENNPEIVKIFSDLEEYLDYCRMELVPYNEADLYNRSSWVWRGFEKYKKSQADASGNEVKFERKNNKRSYK